MACKIAQAGPAAVPRIYARLFEQRLLGRLWRPRRVLIVAKYDDRHFAVRELVRRTAAWIAVVRRLQAFERVDSS